MAKLNTITLGQPITNNIHFLLSDGSTFMSIEEGKFIWKGKEVKDVKKIYERFSQFLNLRGK